MNRPALLGCALIALAPIASCASTPTSSPAAVAGPELLGDGRYQLVVHGMSCPKCISNVELQLTRIGGIVRPTVDMKNGLVAFEVEGGRQPSKARIASAIADSGFTLVEIRGGLQ